MLTSNLFIGMLSSDVLFGGSFPFSISPAPQKHPSHWHIGWIEPILKKVWVCRNLHKNLLRGVRHIRVHLYEVWFCVGSPSRRHICQSRATSSSAASVFLPGLHSGNLVRSELGSSFPSVRWCLAFPWAAVGFGFSCRNLVAIKIQSENAGFAQIGCFSLCTSREGTPYPKVLWLKACLLSMTEEVSPPFLNIVHMSHCVTDTVTIMIMVGLSDEISEWILVWVYQ